MSTINSKFDLNKTISKSIESNNLNKFRILVGVSGGPDSIALLYSLNDIKNKYDLSIFGAHLNHGIRSTDSDNDQQFVEKKFRELKIPFLTKKVNLKNITPKKSSSLENIARIERHKFLFDASNHFNTDLVALGHHIDDQAETIMLHIIRGSGLEGIKGMTEISTREIYNQGINIYRPLLSTSRLDILKYLSEKNIDFHTDVSNYSTKYTRNSIRHSLMPELEAYNPEIKKSLYRLSESVKYDLNFLEEFSKNQFNEISEISPNQIIFKTEKLLELSPSILFRVIKHSFTQLTENQQDIEMIHFKMVVSLIKGETGKKIQLPKNLTVMKHYDQLIVTTNKNTDCILPEIDKIFSLNIPGTTFINDWEITTTSQTKPFNYENIDTNIAWIKYNSNNNRLYVRKRKKGDKFLPSGMTNNKKIQDYMVDQKIPQYLRDRIPLLVNEKDEILWIVGWRTSELAKTHCEQKALKINFQLHTNN
ncbi:MAG: tRNA lysidine(34) synthetase TilS [Dehalococcoidia bacterium]